MLASGNSKNLKSVTGIMEQEQHERNRGVVKEDLISELPEELLLHILSSLPTKRVIATSVLSKRWRSLWKMVPKLEFNSNFHYTHQFSENVGRTLFSHKAPVLESFHLKVSGRYSQSRACDEIDIGVWTEIAFERHVRELVLELCSERCVRFPISMFSFSTTLETLILKYSVLVDVPSPVCMKSLRTLHLESVDFKDSESIRNLISGCPNLEELVIYQCYRKDVVLTFTIVAPFLKRLVITDYFVGSENGGYVINAPSLKYLTLKGVSHYGCCLIENVPMLVEAKIREVSYIANENIVGSLTSVKRLFLDVSPLEIKFPTDSIFYQLVHLKMHTRREEWWNLLMLMLNSSPKLQFLKLTDEKRKFRKRGLVGRKWIEPKNVPECLLPHLKMFVWTRYRWESELEKEVATYILKNARQLKNASFSRRPIHSKEHHKLEERCKMVKELDGVVRASSSCHLVFVVDSVE